MKEYLVSLAFKMYIAVQERVIGAVLLQEEDGKEFSVAYVSRCLPDAETRYVFVENFPYLYMMCAPSLGIISILVLAYWLVNTMLLSICS
jgi:hypothetical protein